MVYSAFISFVKSTDMVSLLEENRHPPQPFSGLGGSVLFHFRQGRTENFFHFRSNFPVVGVGHRFGVQHRRHRKRT